MTLPAPAPRSRSPGSMLVPRLLLGCLLDPAHVAGAAPGGDVQGRVAVEKAPWLEPEGHGVGRHDRPVFHPGEVMDAEDVPQHDVGVLDGAVLSGPGWQACVCLALVAELPAR